MSRRVLRPAVLMLCGALVAASCGDDAGSQSADRADRWADSAVGVVAAGCSLVDQLGSGVVLVSAGQVVTVAHAIAGAAEITVVAADGTDHPATVSAFDEDSDLAVLDVPTLGAEPLPIGEVATGPGSLLVWSRDRGTETKPIDVVKPLRITIEDIYTDDIVQRTGLEIAGPIEIGDSGGPIVTHDGEVIGIVYANSRDRDGVGFATDSAEIRNLLSSRSETPVSHGRCF
jgi:S1-C subfamily serine protease